MTKAIPYSVMLHTHAKYNLPFASKDKHLLANKGTKSLYSLHQLLILVITTWF